jgi:hypothetical protein
MLFLSKNKKEKKISVFADIRAKTKIEPKFQWVSILVKSFNIYRLSIGNLILTIIYIGGMTNKMNNKSIKHNITVNSHNDCEYVVVAI